jgi:hypothetical protein
VRPDCEAVPMPRHNMIIGAKRTPGGLAGIWPGGANTFPAGVRSPPLRGGASGGEMALRGEPGDDAQGGFLGGTHSVRPDCMAKRRPRHLIPTTSASDGAVA